MARARDRILVADDSAVVRTVVTRALAPLLTSRGIVVVEASSLKEGLAIDSTTLLAAVLDFDLGDGSGATLGDALRRSSPDLPLAFFSDDASAASATAHLGPRFRKPEQLPDLVGWATRVSAPA